MSGKMVRDLGYTRIERKTELDPQLESDLKGLGKPSLIGELAGSNPETVFDHPGIPVDIRNTYSAEEVIDGCRILLDGYNGSAHVAYIDVLDKKREEENKELEEKVENMGRRSFLRTGVIGGLGVFAALATGAGGYVAGKDHSDKQDAAIVRSVDGLEESVDRSAEITDVWDLISSSLYSSEEEVAFYSETFEKDKFEFGEKELETQGMPLAISIPSSATFSLAPPIPAGNENSLEKLEEVVPEVEQQLLTSPTHYSFNRFDFNFKERRIDDVDIFIKGINSSINPNFYFWNDGSWVEIQKSKKVDRDFQLSLDGLILEKPEFSLLVFPTKKGYVMQVDSVKLSVRGE
ncbi:hypothetical protein CL618_01140 [archaeon]|nr:hypothetical protein [archaeon]